MIVLLGQPAHQLARGRRRVLELTQVAHFAATSAIATAFFAFEVSRPIKASPYPDMARPLYRGAGFALPPRPFLYRGDEPPHLFSGHTVLPEPDFHRLDRASFAWRKRTVSYCTRPMSFRMPSTCS